VSAEVQQAIWIAIIFVILAAIRNAIFGEEKFTTIDVAQA